MEKETNRKLLRCDNGKFDGEEVCELVGIYISCFLPKIISKKDCGLSRDDGQLILQNVNGQQIDRMR